MGRWGDEGSGGEDEFGLAGELSGGGGGGGGGGGKTEGRGVRVNCGGDRSVAASVGGHGVGGGEVTMGGREDRVGFEGDQVGGGGRWVDGGEREGGDELGSAVVNLDEGGWYGRDCRDGEVDEAVPSTMGFFSG